MSYRAGCRASTGFYEGPLFDRFTECCAAMMVRSLGLEWVNFSPNPMGNRAPIVGSCSFNFGHAGDRLRHGS